MDWLRDAGAAIGGYAVMFAVAFVLFAGLWLVLGAEGAFDGDGWAVSGGWVAGSLVLGLMVSLSGGFACARMSPRVRAVSVLVALVMIMAFVQAPQGLANAGPRPADVSMFDAMSSAVQPWWLLYVNPLIGVAGVLVGARLARGSRTRRSG